MKVMVGDQPLLVEGKPVQVIFSYKPPLSAQDANKGRAVACYLKQPPDGAGAARPEPLAIGLAFLHPVDQFDKTIGRKTALKHALDASPLSREQRGQVWEWFFKVCTQPERER